MLDDVLSWFSDVEEITQSGLSVEGSATEKVSLYFLELFSKQKAEFSNAKSAASNVSGARANSWG